MYVMYCVMYCGSDEVISVFSALTCLMERPPIPQIEPSSSAEIEMEAPMKLVKPPAVIRAFHPQAVISFADWITRVERSRHKSPARSISKEFRDFLIE